MSCLFSGKAIGSCMEMDNDSGHVTLLCGFADPSGACKLELCQHKKCLSFAGVCGYDDGRGVCLASKERLWSLRVGLRPCIRGVMGAEGLG